jgi:hypothetical protein
MSFATLPIPLPGAWARLVLDPTDQPVSTMLATAHHLRLRIVRYAVLPAKGPNRVYEQRADRTGRPT